MDGPGHAAARAPPAGDGVERARDGGQALGPARVGHGHVAGGDHGGRPRRQGGPAGAKFHESQGNCGCHGRASLPAWSTVLEPAPRRGGRRTLVVAGASFTVRARDKVGLVGRNGAGKTSLLRVLGGAAARRAGLRPAHRRPRLPVAGPPARRRARRPHRPAATCCRAGASTRPWPASRSCASQSRRTRASERRRFTRAEERFRIDGGYAAETEVRRLAAGLGLGADRLDLPARRAVRRRAAPGRAGPHPVRRQRRAPARRAHQPPRRRRQGVAAQLPPRLPRRAARHQPRPRPARRGHHPRHPPRAPRRGRHRHDHRVQGHLQPVPRRPASATRCAWPRWPPRSRPRSRPARRPWSTGSGPRQRRRPMAHSLEKRIARIEAERVDGPAKRRPISVRFPEPPARGPGRARGRRPGQVLRRPDVFDDVTFDVGRGERLLVMGLNGAGKTSLLRILAGVTEADAGTVRFGHQVVGRLLRPGARRPRSPAASLVEHMREQAGLPDAELRGLLGMFGLTGDKVFQDAGHAVGRREDQARAGPARGRPPQPAAPRRAHQQPRPAQPRGGRRRARRRGPARWSSSATTPSSSSALRPDRVLLMPDGDARLLGRRPADLVALA